MRACARVTHIYTHTQDYSNKYTTAVSYLKSLTGAVSHFDAEAVARLRGEKVGLYLSSEMVFSYC